MCIFGNETCHRWQLTNSPFSFFHFFSFNYYFSSPLRPTTFQSYYRGIFYYVIGIAAWGIQDHTTCMTSERKIKFSKVSLISLHSQQLDRIFGCATWRWWQLASWYFFPSFSFVSIFPFTVFYIANLINIWSKLCDLFPSGYWKPLIKGGALVTFFKENLYFRKVYYI